jgi:hypothetical protein
MVYALPEQTYRLSPEAYTAFRAFQAWYEGAKQDERLLMSADTFMTAFGKLEGTAGRLILMFHITEAPFSPTVSVGIVNRVVQLIQTYIIPAYRYALSEAGGIAAFDQWVAEYIIHHFDRASINLSELKRSARRWLEGTPNVWTQDHMVLSAMGALERAGWVVRIDGGDREHHHHAEWAINPALGETFKDHRKQVILARQRVVESRYAYTDKTPPRVHGYNPDDYKD